MGVQKCHLYKHSQTRVKIINKLSFDILCGTEQGYPGIIQNLHIKLPMELNEMAQNLENPVKCKRTRIKRHTNKAPSMAGQMILC